MPPFTPADWLSVVGLLSALGVGFAIIGLLLVGVIALAWRMLDGV